MGWLLLGILLGALFLAPLLWAALRVSKLRFLDSPGEDVLPDDVPETIIASLTVAAEPLLEVGFQIEGLRKGKRGLTESWQALLSSAEGLVWCVVETPAEPFPSARRVTLYSADEQSGMIVTPDGGRALPLPHSQPRASRYSSALAQSEAHAAVLMGSDVELLALGKESFLMRLESLHNRRMDRLFDGGWLQEEPESEELRIPWQRLLPAGFFELRNRLIARKATHVGGISWWLDPVEEIPEEREISTSQDALSESENTAAEEPHLAQASEVESTPQRLPTLPHFPANSILAEGAAIPEASALPAFGEEPSSEREPELAAAAEEGVAMEDGWERDLMRYRAGATRKSWAYWFRAQGKALALFAGITAFILWSIASGACSRSFALNLLFAFLLHELGHIAVMLIRRKWDWSLLLLPLPRPQAAKKWPIEGGCGEMLALLAGPLPGLVLGWALMGFAFWGGRISESLLDFALACLVINSFLLLPIRPLDGGRLWDLLLFRRIPILRVFSLAVGGFLIGATFLLGGGPLVIVGALLLWAAIPAALQRAKLLPWMRANLATNEEQAPEIGLAVLRDQGARRFLNGPGGFAKLDELMGLGTAKNVSKPAIFLGISAVLVSLVLPIVMPGVALGSRSFAWFQTKQEAKVLVQEYLGARPAIVKGENVDYDLGLLQEGFETFPNEPEKVLADPQIFAALNETKWRGVGAWIDEDPAKRQAVLATCVEALRRDASRSADDGLADRAFGNLSLAIRILVECEPRHSLDSWLAWSELERDILKELEDVTSRYPLKDVFSQWYEVALTRTPQQTPRKLAGLILQEKANATLTLQGSPDQFIQKIDPLNTQSPGARFLAFFRQFGDLVPVESVRQQIALATAISQAQSPFFAPEILESRGVDSSDLKKALARVGINRTYREIAITALQIKRFEEGKADQQIANLEKRSGLKATIQTDGQRESLLISRLNENGDEVQMEWLLKR